MNAHDGVTLKERLLSDLMAALGWLLMLLAVATAILHGVFETDGFAGGLLVAGTFITGIVLVLGSSGLRQNRSAMELAYGLLAVLALGWVVRGVIDFVPAALVLGLVLGASFGGLVYLRMQALRARYDPRFLSLRQFETMVAIADAMIEGGDAEVMDALDVALNVDRALGLLETPLLKDIRLVLFIVEWALPLRIARPFPFSALGTHDRRRVVEKVVGARGLFRDVARFLKLLSCIGYYSSPAAMRAAGYIPFEERARSRGVDQTPIQFIDPFLAEMPEAPR